MNKQLNEHKNKIVKDEDPADLMGLHEIAEAKTPEELKAAIVEGLTRFNAYIPLHEMEELQQAVKNLLKNPGDPEIQKALSDKFLNASRLTVIDQGKYVRSVVHVRDQDYVLQLREQLIEEYQAYSPSSKLIVDMAVTAYFRSMRASYCSVYIMHNAEGKLYVTEQLKVNLLKEVNKEVEMANRQFMTAITFLKELKQPPIKVKVHAKQAFVAENQQFNKNA